MSTHSYSRGEAPITTPLKRSRLVVRGKPYFSLITAGLHLGYRRNKNSPATWTARRTLGTDKYEYHPLGTADDIGAPHGSLTYAQAAQAATEWFGVAAVATSSITVRQAIEAYAVLREKREADRSVFTGPKRFRSAMSRVLSHPIADIQLSRLTKADLKAWRAELAATQAIGKDGTLSVSSVRRVCKDLSAALRHAAQELDLASVLAAVSGGLRADKAEVVVNNRTTQVLSDAEVRSIVDAARAIDAEEELGGDLARLILVMAATGARFSQVQRLKVGDVDVARSRLNVPPSHKGSGAKARSHTPVPVPAEVIEALLPALNGRTSGDYLLERTTPTGRDAWASSDEFRGSRWASIVRRAGLGDDLIPYCLRHSSIVAWLKGRFPATYVAKLHETSVAMLESNYARFVVDAFDDMASEWVSGRTYASAPVVTLRVAS